MKSFIWYFRNREIANILKRMKSSTCNHEGKTFFKEKKNI